MSSSTGVKRKPRRRNGDGLRLIENESNRQVTFSKRKGGLFRKAGHLSLMSKDVQVAVLVLSTKGRPYSFGSPSVDAVLDRYLNNNNNNNVNVVADDDGFPEKFRDDDEGMWWWEAAVEGMGEEDLTKYRDFLVKLKMMIQEKMMRVHQLPSNY